MSDRIVNAIGFVLLAFAVLIMIGVWVQIKEDNEYRTLHKCQLVHQEFTGVLVYCGKACNRPQLRLTYQCDNGPQVYLQ
ncbi:hypothetical protein D3C71_77160 [compost metagenome]